LLTNAPTTASGNYDISSEKPFILSKDDINTTGIVAPANDCFGDIHTNEFIGLVISAVNTNIDGAHAESVYAH
jgi:hypothetical protein